MLPESMISRRRVSALPFSAIALALSLITTACEKVPLLAPTGSTIILTAGTNVLAINGTSDIVAQVLEAAGTPPHSGTVISFTTTLGSIEPADARTDVSGRVVVKFRAGTGNGTATITATSGGATTGSAGALKISVGTAAVGSVSLSANPNPVSSNSSLSTITANVVDVNGNALPTVSVRFSTTAGTLGASFALTDQNGVAQTTLTTSAQATVTATVGATAATPPATGGGDTTTTPPASTGTATATVQVNVNPLPTVSIAAPTGTLTAGSPIVFTITAQPGANSTAQIRNVRVNFGDGEIADLGAVSGTGITVQHRYDEDDTYQVRVTVQDTFGGENAAATVIVVLPQPPLSVSLNVAPTPAGPNTIYTFTATVIPSTETVASYQWRVDLGAPEITTNNQFIRTFTTGEVHTVTVLITTTGGRTASSSRVIP
jgi:hypothetical protein